MHEVVSVLEEIKDVLEKIERAVDSMQSDSTDIKYSTEAIEDHIRKIRISNGWVDYDEFDGNPIL